MTTFSNPLQLPQVIISSRLTALDPLAECRTFRSAVRDIDEPDVVIEVQYYADVEAAADEEQIQAVLATPLTAQENAALLDFTSAAQGFNALPNWATWTVSEAGDYVHNNVFAGQTQAQLDSWVDVNVTNIAGARVALKQIIGAMLSIRLILEAMAQAIIFFRNLIIRVRK